MVTRVLFKNAVNC